MKLVEKVERNKFVRLVFLRKEVWDCKGDSKNRVVKKIECGYNWFRVLDEFGMGLMVCFF